MKLSDIKKLDRQQILEEISKLKLSLVNNKMLLKSGRFKNTKELTNIKKSIARLWTVYNQKVENNA